MKTYTKEWLKKAEADIDTVNVLLDNDFKHYAIICFHIQQTAEKYVKAYLTEINIEFKKTHDIEQLINLFIDTSELNYDDIINAAGLLSIYGVLPRYPGDYPEISKSETMEALEALDTIKNFILQKI